MRDFIWHLRGIIPIDPVDSNDEVLGRIELLLDQQQKFVVRRSSDHTSFETPLWLSFVGFSWLAMVMYDQGKFWIEQDREGRALRYDLRSLHAFVFCLLISSPFFIGGIMELAEGTIHGLLGFALGFLLFAGLYGLNIAFAKERVPAAIREAVAHV